MRQPPLCTTESFFALAPGLFETEDGLLFPLFEDELFELEVCGRWPSPCQRPPPACCAVVCFPLRQTLAIAVELGPVLGPEACAPSL